MLRTHVPRRAVLASALAGLMVAAALPVHAVNIPEGGAVTPGSTFLFHLRVTDTCDGLPMDELEVTLPETVVNPKPEAVPGWDVSIEDPAAMDDEMADAEADADVDEDVGPVVVRWSGGTLEDGYLLDFGIRARFPEDEGEVLEFPVIQRCGEVELEHVPTIKLAKRYGQGDIAELSAEIDQLNADVGVIRADVDQLQKQVGDVNVNNLRSRVGDTEKAIGELDTRVTAIEEGEPVPEPAPEE
jgi:uncharacterized protein YcnI